MDDLLRPSRTERRNRRIITIAGLALIVIAVAVITGIRYGLRTLKVHNLPVQPAAYLVAIENQGTSGSGNVYVKISGKKTKLETTLKVPAGATIELPEGLRAGVIYAKDWSSKILDGPVTLSSIPVDANQAVDPANPVMKDVRIDFLGSPTEFLVAGQYHGPAEPTGRVLVTSPFGITRFKIPTISWEPRPGVRYDVAVVDPADEGAPPRIARDVLPPVRVDQLETTMARSLAPDRLYAVIVREAGSDTEVGAMRFLVAPNATDDRFPIAPADLIMEAVQALEKKPTRTGDAWLALSRLPADWADTELALRLRMRAAAELGLFDDMAQIQYKLWIMLGGKPPAQR